MAWPITTSEAGAHARWEGPEGERAPPIMCVCWGGLAVCMCRECRLHAKLANMDSYGPQPRARAFKTTTGASIHDPADSPRSPDHRRHPAAPRPTPPAAPTPPTRRRFLYAWQCVVFTHAALSHWGEDARLLFTDFDEFVALPASATLHQIIGRRPGAAVIYLFSHFVLNGALNLAGNESAAWRAAAAGGGGAAAAGAGAGGAAAAARRSVAAMLQLLRTYALRAGPCAAKRDSLGQVKSLVDPNRVDQVGRF
jgi:hypothetical protein